MILFDVRILHQIGAGMHLYHFQIKFIIVYNTCSLHGYVCIELAGFYIIYNGELFEWYILLIG